MDVVKIKCGNSFSENEVKGHHPVLTVFHIEKTKKAKLQSFLDFFSSKFQFLLLNNDISLYLSENENLFTGRRLIFTYYDVLKSAG